MNCFQCNRTNSTNIDSTVFTLDHRVLTESSNETFNYRHKSKDLIPSIHSCNRIKQLLSSKYNSHRNNFYPFKIWLWNNDIRIGPNIEITINIVNQYAHRIVQDVIKSNRDIVCVPRIENISNKKTFKFDYSESNQI